MATRFCSSILSPVIAWTFYCHHNLLFCFGLLAGLLPLKNLWVYKIFNNEISDELWSLAWPICHHLAAVINGFWLVSNGYQVLLFYFEPCYSMTFLLPPQSAFLLWFIGRFIAIRTLLYNFSRYLRLKLHVFINLLMFK